jgi:hypothetical protein
MDELFEAWMSFGILLPSWDHLCWWLRSCPGQAEKANAEEAMTEKVVTEKAVTEKAVAEKAVEARVARANPVERVVDGVQPQEVAVPDGSGAPPSSSPPPCPVIDANKNVSYPSSESTDIPRCDGQSLVPPFTASEAVAPVSLAHVGTLAGGILLTRQSDPQTLDTSSTISNSGSDYSLRDGRSPAPPPTPSKAGAPATSTEEAGTDPASTSESTSCVGGVTGGPLVSSVGVPPASVALEREVGTVLDVHWSGEGMTYRGQVEKYDDGMVLLFYPCDKKRKWHDFCADGCTVTVVEPPGHLLASLCRTVDGYDGQVVPGGRWYTMTPGYVEEHFRQCGESMWLQNLGDKFTPVPLGSSRSRKTVESIKDPFCVFGSLAKCLRYEGYTASAVKVEADQEASLLAKDRLKFAAERAPSFWFQAEKVHANPLEVQTDHPTLLQVSRCHAVTIFRSLIFDSNEHAPLPLSRANLDRCIGAPFVDGMVVRGYRFVPQKKALKRARE